ncbi:tetratricopeptide repeat protein [Candidatus Latescibacterota bacterium]
MSISHYHLSIKALLVCTVLSFPLMSAAQNPAVQTLPGDLSLADGEFADAIEIFEKDIASGNADANVYIKYGIALYNDGEYEKAVELLKSAGEKFPGNIGIRFQLGLALFETGELTQSEEHLASVIEGSPSHAGARTYLAHVLNKLKRYNEAAKHYHRAIKDDPRNCLLHIAAGRNLHDSGDFDGAIEHYSAALALDADIPEAYNLIGLSYAAGSDSVMALDYFSRALEADPNNADAYRYRAQIYCGMNDDISGRECYIKAIAIDGNDAFTLFELGNLLKRNGDAQQANDYFERANTIDPSYSPALEELKEVRRGKRTPKLSATLKFLDFNGDGVLSVSERGAIDIEVTNIGKGEANGVTPVITPLTELHGITIDDPPKITRLMANRSMKMKIALKAPGDVPVGEITLKIEIKEKWGFDLEKPLEITIKTGQ